MPFISPTTKLAEGVAASPASHAFSGSRPNPTLPGEDHIAEDRLFSLFLKLRGRRAVVVGGGSIAEDKVRSLLGTGAEIQVISPQATPAIASWDERRLLAWERRAFLSGDLKGAFLVISATGNPQVDAGVFAEAEAAGALCNAVDDPPHCHFYFPAVVRRGPLQIAISTSGHSPALAQRLRQELERRYGFEYAPWVLQLGKYRQQLLANPAIDPGRRRELLHRSASASGHLQFKRQFQQQFPGQDFDSSKTSQAASQERPE